MTEADLQLPMRLTDKTKHWLAAIICIFAAAVVIFVLWWTGFFLPGWIIWQDKTLAIPAGINDVSGELVLHNRKLQYQRNGVTLYETDPAWYISDMLITDIDMDGDDEAVMLVWNHENYGDHHPFWETNDSFSFSQHLYIYDLLPVSLQPEWMSSRLAPNIKDWDIDCDQIITITDPYDNTSQWQWQGRSIVRIDE